MVEKNSEPRTKSADPPLTVLRGAVGGIEAGAIGKCSTPNGWAIFAPLTAGRGAQKRSLSHRRLQDEFLIGDTSSMRDDGQGSIRP